MASRIYADRVKETTSTAGTSADITLNGPDAGYRSFASVMTIGDTCFYCEENGVLGQWETGIATLINATTLRKAAIVSNEGNYLCTFVGGVKSIFLTQTAKAFDEIAVKQLRITLSQNQTVVLPAVTILNVYEAYGDGTVGLIPAMTSATSPSGVVTSQYTGEPPAPTYDPWRAFDGQTTSCYIPDFGNSNHWLQYAFTTQKLVNRWAMYVDKRETYNSIPLTFDLLASNDGTNFTVISGFSYANKDLVPAGWTSYYLPENMAYRYFRFNLKTTWSNYFNGVIWDLQLYSPATVRALTPATDYTVTRATLDYGVQDQIVTRLKAGSGVDHIIEYI